MLPQNAYKTSFSPFTLTILSCRGPGVELAGGGQTTIFGQVSIKSVEWQPPPPPPPPHLKEKSWIRP